MASFDEKIKQACDTREIAGVALVAVDMTGKTIYQKAFGPKSPTEPMTTDTTFIMASCTKLMASIAALQSVERGQIGLDDDLSTVLTEFKDIQIITGFEEGTETPILKKAENKITLRHLLTHTSGFSYDASDPLLTRWRRSKGEEPGRSGMRMMERLQVPLLFEPGSSWMYGMSIDWAGVLAARLNNTTLEEYLEANVWEPLGIKDITFHTELKPEVKKNLVIMSQRDGTEPFDLPVDTGKPMKWYNETLYDDPIPTGDEFGGQGSMSSAVEYAKILSSLLINDSKLLKPSTVDLMFTPQLTDVSRSVLTESSEDPIWKDTFSSNPVGTKLDWGLAGMLTLSDVGTGRRKGALTWSGLPNLMWTLDREAGLATFYASNTLPWGDQKTHAYQQMFETEMYSRFGKPARSGTSSTL